MDEMILSHRDRSTLENIQYSLECLATTLERIKPEYYEISDGAIINLNCVQSLTKCQTNPFLYFYMGGYNEGEMTFTKKFETVEARDDEYKRLVGEVKK